MLRYIEPGERLFVFAPAEQERLRAIFDAEPVDTGNLNPKLVRISRIAAVRQIPDVAKDDNSLSVTKEGQPERVLGGQNNRIPSRGIGCCDDSLERSSLLIRLGMRGIRSPFSRVCAWLRSLPTKPSA